MVNVVLCWLRCCDVVLTHTSKMKDDSLTNLVGNLVQLGLDLMIFNEPIFINVQFLSELVDFFFCQEFDIWIHGRHVTFRAK